MNGNRCQSLVEIGNFSPKQPQPNLRLREKILNMTADQRKKLGINKSTLWYIQRNFSEGKNPKIYEKVISKIQ